MRGFFRPPRGPAQRRHPGAGWPTAAAAEPVGSLPETLAKGVPPGTVVTLRGDAGPVAADPVAENLRGQPDKPVVIRGVGERRAVIRGRLQLKGAAFLTMERLAFEPEAANAADGAWVVLEGDHITLRDCTIRGVSADGLRLAGADNVMEGGELAACEGYGVKLDGTAPVNGLRVVACRRNGLRVGGRGVPGGRVAGPVGRLPARTDSPGGRAARSG